MRIAITGAGGQLGRALQLALGVPEHTLLALRHDDLDVADLPATLTAIAGFRPEVVIHAAAQTNVDGCETDPAGAYRANALGTRNVAVAAAQAGASLVYISTNYVFDGAAAEPYHEWSATNPISHYGASKLAGEGYARDLSGGRYYIVRTAWIYAEEGRNFVRTMLRLAGEGRPLRGVDDQRAQPTYAGDLAIAIAGLITTPAYGHYHLTNAGAATPYDWAREALRLAGKGDVPIEPIPASAFARPARPPVNGLLHNWAGAAIGITLRPWQEALAECVGRMEG